MTDDSGVAAMSVSARLLELRQTCDSMDIKWHWKHKESSLEKLINIESVEVADQADPYSHADVAAFPERVREKREVPQDVLDALAYCDGYHRGNTKRIRAYIEELRNVSP